MQNHQIVSRDAWVEARRALLAEEKAFTAARDRLAERRRALPWVRVDKPYGFDTADGRKSLADLFAGRGQLVVYHFMFDPSWEAGCKSCSFWADQFDGIAVHLAQRDVALAAVARAPLPQLDAFRRRMGWRFPLVSSFGGDFNHDFQVSFSAEELQRGVVTYNYAQRPMQSPEMPGISVFLRDGGQVFHTYSAYARGLDMLNATYQLLDLVPKGRDETGLSYPMAWVRHHDAYGA